MDMICPYKARTPKGERTLYALTMIDPTAGSFEVRSKEVALLENLIVIPHRRHSIPIGKRVSSHVHSIVQVIMGSTSNYTSLKKRINRQF
jgi:hypothetical protein